MITFSKVYCNKVGSDLTYLPQHLFKALLITSRVTSMTLQEEGNEGKKQRREGIDKNKHIHVKQVFLFKH